jgi:predicted nucleic acid-binding protein
MQRLINATDAPILAAVLASQADCLVTGNTRHFTPEVARRARIRIVSATGYLEELG